MIFGFIDFEYNAQKTLAQGLYLRRVLLGPEILDLLDYCSAAGFRENPVTFKQ